MADWGRLMMLAQQVARHGRRRGVAQRVLGEPGLYQSRRRVWGKWAGVLGLGRIGFEVAKRLSGGDDLDIADSGCRGQPRSQWSSSPTRWHSPSGPTSSCDFGGVGGDQALSSARGHEACRPEGMPDQRQPGGERGRGGSAGGLGDRGARVCCFGRLRGGACLQSTLPGPAERAVVGRTTPARHDRDAQGDGQLVRDNLTGALRRPGVADLVI